MASLSGRPRRLSSGDSPFSENQIENGRFGDFDTIDNGGSGNTAIDDGILKDAEVGGLLGEKVAGNQPPRNSPNGGFCWAGLWIVVNTLATIGIVCFLAYYSQYYKSNRWLTSYRSSRTRLSSQTPH